MTINCDYSTPKQIDNIADTTLVGIYDYKQPWNFASSTCVSYDVASTTNGFTYGEVINSSFSFIQIIFTMFVIYKIMTGGIKTYQKDYDL